MSRKKAAGADATPITIKKYANRRLYNTATSSYVTLEDLCQMVKEGTDFVVYDAKTGEDLTRSVLTQIIVEEESKGQNLLPIKFLRQLIGFYGGSLQDILPRYLESSMHTFTQNQERLRKYLMTAFGTPKPFSPFEEIGKQNLAIFERMMELFVPFADTKLEKESEEEGGAAKEAKPSEQALRDLRQQVEVMQRRLEEIAKKSRE